MMPASFRKIISCPKCGKQMQSCALGGHRRACGVDLVARFWSWVEKGDGCWLWKGAKHRDGYGRANFQKNGKKQIRIAHRIAWEIANGRDVPEGMDVLHTCDVRLCCNPEHLWLGTHNENMRDCLDKGRTTKGERSGTALLTEAQVREILASYVQKSERKSNIRALAAQYGVSYGAVLSIVRRRNWKHVQPSDIGERST